METTQKHWRAVWWIVHNYTALAFCNEANSINPLLHASFYFDSIIIDEIASSASLAEDLTDWSVACNVHGSHASQKIELDALMNYQSGSQSQHGNKCMVISHNIYCTNHIHFLSVELHSFRNQHVNVIGMVLCCGVWRMCSK